MTLARALSHLCRQLEDLGRSYAVVGGLAASARGDVRFTRDVDVAVDVTDDEEAEAVVFALHERGYEILATVEQQAMARLSTARLRSPEAEVVCDLIFATSGIEGEVVESATRLELFPGQRVPTATVESLLAMKILSATPRRPRDIGDIQALHRAHPELDEERVRALLRAISARGFDRSEHLEEKWRRLRQQLGV